MMMDNAMIDHTWVKEFPGAITVCDADGIILEHERQSDQVV